MDSLRTRKIGVYLSAFRTEEVKAGLRYWAELRRGLKADGTLSVKDVASRDSGTGWKIYDREEDVPKPYDRMKLADGKWYAGPSVRAAAPHRPRGRQRRRHDQRDQGAIAGRKAWSEKTGIGTAWCPVCGSVAYPEPVCTKCMKGRAGLRIMWVCGENSDHVCYTERSFAGEMSKNEGG